MEVLRRNSKELDFDLIMDLYERYRIMSEVFLAHVPDNEKIIALSQAADRIWLEITQPSEKK